MSDKGLAVTVPVRRQHGRTEHVRVGTAVRAGHGFHIQFRELSIEGAGVARGVIIQMEQVEPEHPSLHQGTTAPSESATSTSIRGLEFCAERARRNLANPAKARWHEDERALLEAIEAELSRQKKGMVARVERGGDQTTAASDFTGDGIPGSA